MRKPPPDIYANIENAFEIDSIKRFNTEGETQTSLGGNWHSLKGVYMRDRYTYNPNGTLREGANMIYIASPYTHANEEVRSHRYKKAEDYAAYTLKQNQVAISPIVYGHHLALFHSLPTDAFFWETFNRALFEACDTLHVLAIDGWRKSKGVAMEIAWAQEHSYPIHLAHRVATGSNITVNYELMELEV